MDDRLGINFTSKITPVKPINDQMTLCKCYVMAPGKNDNKTNIPKEAVEDAVPTLFNIPVVGHLFVDEDNEIRMGGHDMELEKTETGRYKFKVLTVPFGVVPKQDNVRFEKVVENGREIEYQVADIILWTGRYPELLEAKYNDEIYFAQSMEILPIDRHREDDGTSTISKYQYSALCLLGKSDDEDKNVIPCFKSARVEPYIFSSCDEAWTKLFEEFKYELAQCNNDSNFEIGGKILNKELILKIMLEFGLTDENQLSFEITDEMDENMLREQLNEMLSHQKQDDENELNEEDTENTELGTDANEEDGAENTNANIECEGEGCQTNVEPESTEDFEEDNGNIMELKFSLELTANETRSKIREKLSDMGYCTEERYEGFDLVDYTTSHIYCIHTIHIYEGKREQETLRYDYVITENGDILIDASSAKAVRLLWLTKEDEEAIEAKDNLLNDLKSYKNLRIEEDRRKAYSDIVNEFSDLDDIDEYKSIVANALSFESEDALREKLYAIRGKHAKKTSKSPLTAIRIPVGYENKQNSKKSELDEFMSKYLPV